VVGRVTGENTPQRHRGSPTSDLERNISIRNEMSRSSMRHAGSIEDDLMPK
jgi:hypothetical protein